jgi:hypothetical protein
LDRQWLSRRLAVEIFDGLRSKNSRYLLKTMSKAMREKVEQIFVSAFKIDAKEDLKDFLDRACQGDDGVRAEVEDMLALRPQIEKMFPEGGVLFALTEEVFNASQRPE